MAIFIGTIQEFHDFIGPKIRNAINNLTRKSRKQLDACEHCGQKRELQSAHIHGRGRRTIIEEVLKNYNNNDMVFCDIGKTESKILEAHHPIDSIFKFLCHDCHVSYDSNIENKNPAPQNTESSYTSNNDEKIKNSVPHVQRNKESSNTLNNEEENEIKKIKRKIPRWFKNETQYNHIILIAFLELQKKQNIITPENLKAECPTIKKFHGNYDQMKHFGDNNHGKVFEEKYKEINLWEPVENFILEEYKKYKENKNT